MELRQTLERAVRRTSVADADVGVFLSGGVDSTVVTALARPAVAFTIDFGEQDYTRSDIVILG